MGWNISPKHHLFQLYGIEIITCTSSSISTISFPIPHPCWPFCNENSRIKSSCTDARRTDTRRTDTRRTDTNCTDTNCTDKNGFNFVKQQQMFGAPTFIECDGIISNPLVQDNNDEIRVKLDTGSWYTVVPTFVALKLKLQNFGNALVSGVEGKTDGFTSYIRLTLLVEKIHKDRQTAVLPVVVIDTPFLLLGLQAMSFAYGLIIDTNLMTISTKGSNEEWSLQQERNNILLMLYMTNLASTKRTIEEEFYDVYEEQKIYLCKKCGQTKDFTNLKK